MNKYKRNYLLTQSIASLTINLQPWVKPEVTGHNAPR